MPSLHPNHFGGPSFKLAALPCTEQPPAPIHATYSHEYESTSAHRHPYPATDVYPTGASASFGYLGRSSATSGFETGILRITFSTASMSGGNQSQLLMLAMPHHRTHLLFPLLTNNISTSRVVLDDLFGALTPVLGDDWYLGYTLSDITWHAPNSVSNPEKRSVIISTLKDDAAKWQGRLPRSDPYFGNSDLAAIGQMALIADDLGAAAGITAGEAADLRIVAASLRSILTTHITNRLTTNTAVDGSLVYDNTWGGLITYRDASSHTNNYFGNNEYNDHHFHYGYLLYAAAALAKGNPAWLEEHRESLLAVLRDYANPRRDDPWFPLARMMDWWGGHSWASGIVAFGDAKNQVKGKVCNWVDL